MQLTPAVERALDDWIGTTTWKSKNLSDMNRWYDFVHQYRRDHGTALDETALRLLIESKVQGQITPALREIIRERIRLGYHILDFLEHTRR